MRVITVNEATGERVYSRTEVARICGVSTQSLRLWEDAGVIPQATRDENGYRYWTEAEVEQIEKYAEIPYSVKRGYK
jgi:predicted site-specific integrase-resolvase